MAEVTSSDGNSNLSRREIEMRKSKAAICVVAVVLGLSTVALAEGDVTVGVGADFMSKYVWPRDDLFGLRTSLPRDSSDSTVCAAGLPWQALGLRSESREPLCQALFGPIPARFGETG